MVSSLVPVADAFTGVVTATGKVAVPVSGVVEVVV